MRQHFVTGFASRVLLASALVLVSGCRQSDTVAAGSVTDHFRASPAIPTGTMIDVILGSAISSETAQVGDRWQGTVSDATGRQVGDLVPGGSRVSGQVVAVRGAERGSRAMLELGLTSIRIDGADRPLHAYATAVVAGSTRKRNIGAIAGGALAGAVVGNNVGNGQHSVLGGVIGGAAATGVVAGSKGFQVELESGTRMSFTVSQSLAGR